MNTRRTEVDLIARGCTWEQADALMKEAVAQAGVSWSERVDSLAINIMHRLANAAHKEGFKLGMERAFDAASEERVSVYMGGREGGKSWLPPLSLRDSDWTREGVAMYWQKRAQALSAMAHQTRGLPRHIPARWQRDAAFAYETARRWAGIET